MMYKFVTIDNNKYAISSGTYIREWARSFNAALTAGIIQLNYVDRGPGVETYSMTLEIATWSPGSDLYNAGITKTADQQMADLETSYLKVASALQFLDPFGKPPRNNFSVGILFVDMKQIVPNFSTNNKTYYKVEVSLTEGAGIQIR